MRSKLTDNLLMHPSTFFTKFGSRIWDFVLKKTGNARLRNRMLLTLFFDQLSSWGIETQCETIDEVANKLPQRFHPLLRENLLAKIDKLVKKELLASNLCHYMLAEVCKKRTEDTVFEFGGFFGQLSDTIFEGCTHLLTTKEGVASLCRLVGIWDAKHKKTFLKTLGVEMKLRKQTLNDYFLNSIDGLFLCRLLDVLDDTRLAIEVILCESFGCKLDSTQSLHFVDKERAFSCFQSPKTCGWIIHLLKPEASKNFLTEEERQKLELPAPSSRKEASIRRGELRNGFFLPLWRALALKDDFEETFIDSHKRMVKIAREELCA
eukprot:Gregarina_sp_Poly_1__8806@NODE_528_length_7666_cov_26_468351_g418_i0_p1_GENE_NODE_528_length_7666_cov_26_468351_g418_i0NODE_528_length_7666_cov_26_468351_g418_i0_p1_ORF_typecomplete_len321_score48_22CPL/PF08144_11/4_9e02CPL/PF08144_11/0_031_NODE_528_length_7666_cov_26_468351_g418_i056876649